MSAGGVALVYEPFFVVEPENQILLGFYSDLFLLPNWYACFGFPIVVAASSFYIIFLLFSILMDIKPRRLILFRLMKDLINIDRYGNRRELRGESTNSRQTSTLESRVNTQQSDSTHKSFQHLLKGNAKVIYEGGDKEHEEGEEQESSKIAAH